MIKKVNKSKLCRLGIRFLISRGFMIKKVNKSKLCRLGIRFLGDL